VRRRAAARLGIAAAKDDQPVTPQRADHIGLLQLLGGRDPGERTQTRIVPDRTTPGAGRVSSFQKYSSIGTSFSAATFLVTPIARAIMV
jgi:hypothetical protein